MAKVFDQLGRPHANRSAFYDKRKIAALGDDHLEVHLKAALLKVSPSVVGVITFGVPPEMTRCRANGLMMSKHSEEDCGFIGSGLIIESEEEGDGRFRSTVITTSSLFTRTNGVQPSEIKAEVFVANGTACDAQVIGCDFHYNLATMTVHSSSPLQCAGLKELDDYLPITHLEAEADFPTLRRHSNLFKIRSSDKILALGRQPYGDLLSILLSIRNSIARRFTLSPANIKVLEEDPLSMVTGKLLAL